MLAVRLHHSDAFAQNELRRYAAGFKTNAGKQVASDNGLKPELHAHFLNTLSSAFPPLTK